MSCEPWEQTVYNWLEVTHCIYTKKEKNLLTTTMNYTSNGPEIGRSTQSKWQQGSEPNILKTEGFLRINQIVKDKNKETWNEIIGSGIMANIKHPNMCVHIDTFQGDIQWVLNIKACTLLWVKNSEDERDSKTPYNFTWKLSAFAAVFMRLWTIFLIQ